MKCKKCGQELSGNATFCGNCGFKNETKAAGNTALIAILIAVIAVLLVAVVLLAFGRFSGDNHGEEIPEAVAEIPEESVETEEAPVEIYEEAEVEAPAEVYEKAEVEMQAEVYEETIEPPPVKPAENYARIYYPGDLISKIWLNSGNGMVDAYPEYATYYDSEHEFFIEYPTHFILSYADDGALRREYTSPDGSAVMRINAGVNSGNVSMSALNNRIISLYGGEVTYNPVNKSWFAISSVNGEYIYYAFYRVKNNIIHGFEFYFVGEEKLDIYEDYITHIYESLRK
ncbi:MAG: zinc ribbon domain-containing protein [Clostridia bacterium]|nr:zinc ribbon domain-containing protein [Clostridia bacterium]